MKLRVSKIFYLIFFISFLLTVPVLAAQGLPVQEYKLKNGLKVLMLEDHKAKLAVFQIWYRVGSVDEVSGKTGISHLLEHMMFKGTKKYGSKELSQTVQRYGGMDNAFTSQDYTAYYQLLPSDRIGLSLQFESDRMQNLLLDPKDTLSERNVVMEERRMRTDDDPQSALLELTEAMAFTAHPYRWPIIGWMDDISNLTSEDLRAYYKAYYSPDNAYIVVVGDIEPAKLFKRIEKAFGDIKAHPRPRHHITKEPSQTGERRVYLEKEAQLPYVLAAYHVPNLPDPDAYALDVLAMILSEGKSGRLYRKLVYDDKLSIDAFAENDNLMRYPHLFFLGGTATPGTPIEKLEQALYAEVDKIKKEPPSDYELQKAVNQSEAQMVMQQDAIQSEATLIARFEGIGSWRLLDQYLDGIRAVTAEDVSRVARTYLTPENRTVGVLVPLVPDSEKDKNTNEKN